MASKHIVMSALATLMCCSSATFAATVFDDGHGKEWRQVTDTQGISWSDIASACPLNGISACNGSVDGVNLTGWTFASAQQVGDLFSYFGDFPGGITLANVPQATSHAGEFLDTAIGPTYTDNVIRFVMGWTSTPTPGGSIWVAEVIQRVQPDPSNTDLWSTADNFGPGQAFAVGSWMWRPAISAVPEPATWALFILGFGAVGGMLRANRRASAVAHAQSAT